jgi:hypothetical protein
MEGQGVSVWRTRLEIGLNPTQLDQNEHHSFNISLSVRQAFGKQDQAYSESKNAYPEG